MTTRRDVLLALARGHDQDTVTAELVDGVCFLRASGEALPAVGVPLVPATFDHAQLAEVAETAEQLGISCSDTEPHEAHRYEIARSGDATALVAYGRCPGRPVPERSP